MNTFKIVLTILFSIYAIPAWSSEATARKEIQALYSQVAKLYAKKDAKGIAGVMLPEAKLKGMDGKTLTRAQWLKETQQQMTSMKTIDIVYKIQTVKLKGQTAVVDRTMRVKAAGVAPSGQEIPINALIATRDTFLKTREGWRLKYSKFKGELPPEGPRPETAKP